MEDVATYVPSAPHTLEPNADASFDCIRFIGYELGYLASLGEMPLGLYERYCNCDRRFWTLIRSCGWCHGLPARRTLDDTNPQVINFVPTDELVELTRDLQAIREELESWLDSQ